MAIVLKEIPGRGAGKLIWLPRYVLCLEPSLLTNVREQKVVRNNFCEAISTKADGRMSRLPTVKSVSSFGQSPRKIKESNQAEGFPFISNNIMHAICLKQYIIYFIFSNTTFSCLLNYLKMKLTWEILFQISPLPHLITMMARSSLKTTANMAGGFGGSPASFSQPFQERKYQSLPFCQHLLRLVQREKPPTGLLLFLSPELGWEIWANAW